MKNQDTDSVQISAQDAEFIHNLWRKKIHKLNNSLAAILGHSTLISCATEGDAQITSLAQNLRKGVRESLEVVDILGELERLLRPALVHLPETTKKKAIDLLVSAIDTADRIAHAPPALSELSKFGGPEQILLIEDDELLRLALQECLEQLGYTTITAEDGAQAIEIFKEHYNEIDLICVDFHLPHRTGVQVSTFIRTLRPSMRIILMSGSPIQNEDPNIYPIGFSEILTKPVELSDFAGAVRKVLDAPPLKRLRENDSA